MAEAKDTKPPMPDPNAYPKWRYHASLPAIVVQSKADEDSRTPSGEGWADSVGETVKPAAPAAPAKPAAAPAAAPVPVKKAAAK